MEKPKKTPDVPLEPQKPEIKPGDPGKTQKPVLPEVLPSHDPGPQIVPPEIKPDLK